MPAQGFWGRTKPPFGTPLERGDPLATGLVGAWAFNAGGGSRITSLVNPLDVFTLTAPSVWGASAVGRTVRSHVTNASARMASPSPILLPATTVSMFWMGTVSGTWTASGNPQIACMEHNSGNSNPYNCWGFYRSDYTQVTLDWNDGSYHELNMPGAIDIANYGRMQDFGLAMGAGSIRGYVDGLFKVSSTSVGTISYGSDPNLILGSVVNDTNYSGTDTAALYIWNRKLSDAEFATLHALPFRMFAPPVWRRYFVPAAAAGGATVKFRRTRGQFGTRVGSRQAAA